MSRIDIGGTSNLLREQEYAEFKNKAASLGIVPIYDMDKLNIYKIKATDELKKLCESYKANLYEIDKVILKYPSCDPWYYMDSLSSFGEPIEFHVPTDEELFEKYNLSNEERKKTFIKNNGTYIKEYNEKNSTFEYRLETFDEVKEKFKKEYLTFVFRRNSKIAAILSLLIEENYFSLEVMADLISELMTSKKVYKKSPFTAKSEVFKKISQPLSYAEKKMSLFDKRSLIKDFIETFDIEKTYSGTIADMPYIGIDGNFKENKVNINRLADENAYLLFNSDFKDTYDRIKTQKIKIK